MQVSTTPNSAAQPSSLVYHAHTSSSSQSTAAAVQASTFAPTAVAAFPEGALSSPQSGAVDANLQGRPVDRAPGLEPDTQPDALHSEDVTLDVPGEPASCIPSLPPS